MEKDYVYLYSKFYPLHEIHQDINYIYYFWPRDGESIAQAWGRLKSLMLKCPNHELSNEIIVNNFYARLLRYDKDMVDASSLGSFTGKNVNAKWDLIERIYRNAEDWEIDKGKETGINYEYDSLNLLWKLKVLMCLVLSTLKRLVSIKI